LSGAYLLAAVLRLARFNLTSDAHSKEQYTLGVPTPIAAGYVMAAVLMGERLPAPWAALVVGAMALLMVSRIALPELKGGGLVSVALLVGIGNYSAVLVWPNWYTVAWWNLWNGVILILDRLARRRDPVAALELHG
jgi:phosphatidylserine synthase